MQESTLSSDYFPAEHGIGVRRSPGKYHLVANDSKSQNLEALALKVIFQARVEQGIFLTVLGVGLSIKMLILFAFYASS